MHRASSRLVLYFLYANPLIRLLSIHIDALMQLAILVLVQSSQALIAFRAPDERILGVLDTLKVRESRYEASSCIQGISSDIGL